MHASIPHLMSHPEQTDMVQQLVRAPREEADAAETQIASRPNACWRQKERRRGLAGSRSLLQGGPSGGVVRLFFFFCPDVYSICFSPPSSYIQYRLPHRFSLTIGGGMENGPVAEAAVVVSRRRLNPCLGSIASAVCRVHTMSSFLFPLPCNNRAGASIAVPS